MSAPTASSSRPAAPREPATAVSAPPEQAVREGAGQVPLWRSAVLLALTLLIVLSYWLNPPMNLQSKPGVVMELPVIVGDYIGKPGEITTAERQILPADTEFARRYYIDSKGHNIECSIVLSGAEQRSIHRPEGCLTSQGWTIVGQSTIPVPLASGRMMYARRLILERQGTNAEGQHFLLRSMYVYWFVGQHITTASEMHRVLLSNWDRVMHNVAHRWAYVSLFSYLTENLQPNGLNAEQTQQLLTDFAKQAVPTFQIDEMPAGARPN